MPETVITVQGRHTASAPAERVTLALTVQFDGGERAVVMDDLSATSAKVSALIDPLDGGSDGPVTRWSSDSVQVWTQRPWANDGTRLAPVHSARVGFRVRFRDFAALARFVDDAAAVPGVGIDHLEWALTDGTRLGMTAEVRSRAVKDAVAKASVYAQSIGLGTVTATALADEGMLGEPRAAGAMQHAAFAAMRSASAGDDAPALSFTPEEIEITAVVDARFLAS